MAICRFNEGDAYVYYQMDDGGVVCAWCRLAEDRVTFVAKDEREMIVHLKEHERAGHRVPPDAFEELTSLYRMEAVLP